MISGCGASCSSRQAELQLIQEQQTQLIKETQMCPSPEIWRRHLVYQLLPAPAASTRLHLSLHRDTVAREQLITRSPWRRSFV
ncbi:unnamed protein product [Lota lota]